MKKEYILPNRYGDSVKLVEVEPLKYELQMGNPDYCSMSYDGEWGSEDMSIFSIDPSGGPFMCVENFTLDGKTLSEIKITDGKYLLIFN